MAFTDDVFLKVNLFCEQICATAVLPLLIMVQSDLEASEGPSARAQHQLWCVREWETSSLPPPWLSLCPNSLRRRFYFTSPRSSRSHRCLRQQAGTWLGFFGVFFLSYLWSLWTFSGGFPVRFAQDIGSPQFPPPPPHSAWGGMRGLPERNSRNSHVWMDKRAESEGIAAEMEGNTLPGAPRKSVFSSSSLP